MVSAKNRRCRRSLSASRWRPIRALPEPIVRSSGGGRARAAARVECSAGALRSRVAPSNRAKSGRLKPAVRAKSPSSQASGASAARKSRARFGRATFHSPCQRSAESFEEPGGASASSAPASTRRSPRGSCSGALRALAEAGVDPDSIVVAHVPGAVEIPLAAAALLGQGKVDAVVALGAVIRGETGHYDSVCRIVEQGILQRRCWTPGSPSPSASSRATTNSQAFESSGEGADEQGRRGGVDRARDAEPARGNPAVSPAAPKKPHQRDQPRALPRPRARAQVPLPGRRPQGRSRGVRRIRRAPGGERRRRRLRARARRRASSRAGPSSTSCISGFARNWALHRMAVIDRNILRIGAFELLGAEAPPRNVVINEAIELAKRFSTAESGRFINGDSRPRRASRRRRPDVREAHAGAAGRPQEDQGEAPRRPARDPPVRPRPRRRSSSTRWRRRSTSPTSARRRSRRSSTPCARHGRSGASRRPTSASPS